VKQRTRKIVVLSSLVGVLTLTSALLLALAPPPLKGESTYDNLWADAAGGQPAGDLVDALFQTKVPARLGHWKYIYIHQSGVAIGVGAGMADHFIIGNGRGRPDGEIQMTQRWNSQVAAGAPAGAKSIDPACVSICLIGNLDKTAPTAEQVRKLTQLVSALQSQLALGGDKVFMMDNPGSAGIGRMFPAAGLRQQILP
jgi:hypothetical protein